MLETDYVWLKPVLAPLAESGALSRAFHFSYINPLEHERNSVMRKMYPASAGPLTDVPTSGPAPVLMRWQELFKVRHVAPSQPATCCRPLHVSSQRLALRQNPSKGRSKIFG